MYDSGRFCVARAVVGKHVRKNLIVDQEKLRELARQRGTTESAAVRWAIDQVLWADQVMEVIEELHKLGGIEDTFGRLEAEGEAS